MIDLLSEKKLSSNCVNMHIYIFFIIASSCFNYYCNKPGLIKKIKFFFFHTANQLLYPSQSYLVDSHEKEILFGL